MKILVAYDGTLNAKDALRYGIRRAQNAKADLIVLAVFDTTKFIDYDVWGAEDKARREAALHVQEAKDMLARLAHDLTVSMYSAEGNLEYVAAEFAKEEHVDLILTPAKYADIVDIAPCRVSILPRECPAC
jgi:nucleotide-binding universal stress UspA family protein